MHSKLSGERETDKQRKKTEVFADKQTDPHKKNDRRSLYPFPALPYMLQIATVMATTITVNVSFACTPCMLSLMLPFARADHLVCVCLDYCHLNVLVRHYRSFLSSLLLHHCRDMCDVCAMFAMLLVCFFILRNVERNSLL